MRLAKKLTQGELATKAGVSQSTVEHWEQGMVVPSKSLLALVSDALGQDQSMMFEWREVELESRGTVHVPGPSAKTKRELLKFVRENGGNINTIVNDLLEFAMANWRAPPLFAAPYDEDADISEASRQRIGQQHEAHLANQTQKDRER